MRSFRSAIIIALTLARTTRTTIAAAAAICRKSSLQAHSERVAPVLYAPPGPVPYRDRLLVLHVHRLEMFDHLQRNECCSMWLPSSPTLADTAGMPWQSAQGALGVLCCTEADGWGGGRAALLMMLQSGGMPCLGRRTEAADSGTG